jgi:DNA polymerase III epsilon subunit-like protein
MGTWLVLEKEHGMPLAPQILIDTLPSIEEEGCLVLDTENTGYPHPGIIQLAVLGLRSGMVWCNMLFAVRWDATWNPMAARVHGITRAQLADKPLFETHREQLIHMFQGRTIIGHNIASDLRALGSELNAEPWKRAVCTLKLAQEHYTLAGYKLGELAAHFQLSCDGALHDALTDTRLTRLLYLHMRSEILERRGATRQTM